MKRAMPISTADLLDPDRRLSKGFPYQSGRLNDTEIRCKAIERKRAVYFWVDLG